ncbi:MAG TPA: 3D domain-containing protein [Vicinamibacterales bacterium]|jgi:3D (Asp-Asp-Asp) domain-containing protein|nr:3D domain-containing protein [Vicinamibacterales bacterium]
MLTNTSTRLTVITLILTLFVSAASAESAARRRARPMAMTATAYCLRGLTSTGGDVRPGIVAADPRVLPMGSRIRIRDSRGGNGAYVVDDQGANVKGRRIDIFMTSCAQAKRFGRQRVMVTVEQIGPSVRSTR